MMILNNPLASGIYIWAQHDMADVTPLPPVDIHDGTLVALTDEHDLEEIATYYQ